MVDALNHFCATMISHWRVIRNWLARLTAAACLAGVSVSMAQGDGESLVDTLNQANLQDAFKMLRQRYVDRGQLTYETLNKAALKGLLAALEPGVQLLPESKGAGGKIALPSGVGNCSRRRSRMFALHGSVPWN